MATALYAAGRDRARAYVLARAARDAFAGPPLDKRLLAEADAWLAAHPVRAAMAEHRMHAPLP